MVHAKNYDAIRFLTERLERGGQDRAAISTPPRGPIPVEREATHRAISYAELIDVPIMIVHVSGREAMEEIRWAQQRGLKVYGETCPQYSSLTADDLEGPQHGRERRKYVCSPPPRDPRARRRSGRASAAGVFQTFSSDHCPFRYEGTQGKLDAEGAHLVPLGAERHPRRRDAAADPVLRRASSKGRITVNEFVALTSTNHAKIYGLYPHKGTIGVGFDADIVLWDPTREDDPPGDHAPRRRLHALRGHGGHRLAGRHDLRGKVVAEEGRIVGEKGDGRFLKRELSPYARPRAGEAARRGRAAPDEGIVGAG